MRFKALTIIACLLAPVVNPLLAGDIVALAVKGDPAPDGNGVLGYASIFALNGGGAAYSTLTTGNTGGSATDFILVTVGKNGAEVVFREGDSAPHDGKFSYSLGQINVNTLGQVAFLAGLTHTSSGGLDDEGVYAGDGSSITQIIRENQPEPMGGPGVFNSFSIPSINKSGQVAVWAAIRNAGTPLIDTHGVFIVTDGTVRQVVRTHAPSPDGNGQILDFNASNISDSGYIAYHADLSETNGGEADSSGIFMGDGSTTVVIVRTHDSSPDRNGRFAILSSPNINDHNQVAFYATLKGTDGGDTDNVGLFCGSGSSLTKIVRLGDPAPDSAGRYQTINQTFALNSSGAVAFTATLKNGAQGIFWSDGIQSKTIALSGNKGPDGDYTFTRFVVQAAINNTRTVAFQADLSYGSDARGLYLSDGEETLLIAKTGDPLDGAILTYLGFDPGTFNDSGEIAFQAIFPNEKYGIYRYRPTLKWRKNGNGEWADTSRWTVSLRPGEHNAVTIDPSAGGIVTGPKTDTSIRSLSLGQTSESICELNLAANVNLTVSEGVIIGKNGRLSGNGDIIGNITNSGKITPGNSVGRINITGDYTQTDSGTLILELGGTTPGLYDQLQASGNIQVDGTLNIQLLDNYSPAIGDTVTLVSAGGALSGSFNRIVTPYFPGIRWEPTQTATAIVLTAQFAPQIIMTAGSPINYQVAAPGEGVPYSVSGLPFGLVFDDQLLAVTGTSQEIGHYVVIVTNDNNGTSASVYLTVAATSQNNRNGSYAGLTIGDARLVGAWKLNRTGTSFTGNFTCDEGILTLKGSFPASGDFRQVAVSGSIKRVPISGTLKWDPTIDRVSLDVSMQGAQATTVDETGSASSWASRGNLYPNPGVFTAILRPSADSTTSQAEGSGFLTLTVNPSGSITVRGETSLGQKITWSGMVPDNYNNSIYWKTPDSSLWGVIETNYHQSPQVAGNLAWALKENSARKAYPAGFVQSLDVAGNRLWSITSLESLFSTAPVLQLGGGGLDRMMETMTLSFSVDDMKLSLPSDNPNQVKLTITPNTGLITGSAILRDTRPADEKTVKRTIEFRGIVVRNADGIRTDWMAGYFLLPTWANTVRSGRMDIITP